MVFLPNPDSCGYFDGGLADGGEMALFQNPDTCGYFDGSVSDGAGMVFFASPVPCPTFYGSADDGFAIGFISCVPLVVEASELLGRIEGEHGYLWWYTYHEVNNLGFSMQKSRDRVEWTEIGFLEGETASDEQKKYSLWDRNMREGVNYYRWMQMDFDGSITLSNVVALVKSNEIKTDMLVYPVPVSNGEEVRVLYQSGAEELCTWRLVDLNGKIVREGQAEMEDGKMELKWTTEDWVQGVYLVIVDQAGQRSMARIVVY